MSKPHLSPGELKNALLYVSEKIIENKNVLTQADKAVGDGDHGVGMARGFEAVRKKLESEDFASAEDTLGTVGTVLMSSVGGAAGAVFGIFFRDGAKHLSGAGKFDSASFSSFLTGGLEAVGKRGGAKAGDKTMVDALGPAAERVKESISSSLDECAAAAAEAAREGMERTKEMTARIGKAKTLGERSLGHPDPGAVTMYLILKYFREYIDSAGS